MKNYILFAIIMIFFWIFYYVEYGNKETIIENKNNTSSWTQNIQSNTWTNLTENWKTKYVIEKKSINELKSYLWMFFIEELDSFKNVIVGEHTLRVEKEYNKWDGEKEYRYLVDKIVLNRSNKIENVIGWKWKTSFVEMDDVGIKITIKLFQWDEKTMRWIGDAFPYGEKIELTLESFEVIKFK